MKQPTSIYRFGVTPSSRKATNENAGAMSAEQFRKALLALGLHNQGEAATVLGISRRTVIRYSLGDTPVPAVVERLIGMLVEHGIPKRFWRP